MNFFLHFRGCSQRSKKIGSFNGAHFKIRGRQEAFVHQKQILPFDQWWENNGSLFHYTPVQLYRESSKKMWFYFQKNFGINFTWIWLTDYLCDVVHNLLFCLNCWNKIVFIYYKRSTHYQPGPGYLRVTQWHKLN